MEGSLLTQLVGSYSKPNWLICHHRVTTPYGDDTFWRPDVAVLQDAQDDATRLAIADQERAGLDVITDGEERRQRFDSYFLRFHGLDMTQLGQWSMDNRDMSFIDLDPRLKGRLSQAHAPPVVDKVGWLGPTALEDLRFLKRHTSLPAKMTVIGPLTAASRLVNEYYPDEETMGMDIASVLNQELRALDAEGADVIQLDEPDFHFRFDQASRWGTRALDVALEGIKTTTAVHICYGYALVGEKHVNPRYGEALEAIAASRVRQISLEYEQPGHGPDLLHHCGDKEVILGLLNLGSQEVETPEHIANRIRDALEVIPENRLRVAPDCGMWFLPRDIAYSKLQALAAGAEIVRRELS